MTRERSTWNINNIAKQAGLKLADPYTMNQDHVRQQPAADAYVIGDPSTFAEDVHPAAGTWEAEYSGGQVKRNEIGMPEMRNDTFNHPEKTASEEVLVKKAAVCVALARTVLPKTASPMDIEEQSISFMHLPDEELMSTFTRLAAKQDQQDQQGQQQKKQAAKQDQQDQQQQVQAAKQDQQDQQGQQQVQAAKQDQQGQQDQQQQVQAAQHFSDPRHTSVRALLAQDQQGQQDQGQKDQKQAGQEQQAQMQQQLAQMIQQAQQQLEQLQAQSQQQQAQQVQQVQAPPAQQQGGEQAGQQQQAQMQQQSQAQQVAQAVQQAIQQGQDPVAAAAACMGQYQQQAQVQQGSDGELIDQMLAQQQQVQPMANMDIELDTPTMDVGEVQLGPEDDMLMQLFANAETEQAQQAQDGGQQQQKQAHAVRTASMRTVGTVPSQGVSRIGGTSTAKVASGGDGSLSSLWSSAPDVREAFGIPTNQ
jgi:hypothetical protein